MSKTFSVAIAEFVRHIGRYCEEAQRAPITLTKHGRPSLVLLSAARFEQLSRASDARRAHHVDDLSPDMAATMLAALESADD